MIDVLLVEDDDGDALLLQEAMQNTTFHNKIYHMKDGVEALDFMQKQGEFSDMPTPDLVLLDLNMPRMNGHEVLSWMRADSKYKRTPVIILTTSNSEHDILSSYEKHANCFITKPVDIMQFNKVVQYIDEFWNGIVKLPPKI